ncbi:MAG TPA: penicillin acylase family protein, partial [Nannocystis sp.]
LLLEQVVARCEGVGSVLVLDEVVDIGAACGVLAGWDGRYDVDSVGAVVWREFLGTYGIGSLTDYGPLLAVGFDPEDPIETPNTLVDPPAPGEEDKVLVSLGRGVLTLAQAGVALDSPLGAVQKAPRADKQYGVPGGQGRDGTANVVTYDVLKTTVDPSTPRGEVLSDTTGLTKDGYVVNYGSSFVMALELGQDGPRGQAFLTYGESDDPASKHYADQTVLFSEQKWRPIVFSEADIAADPELATLEVAGGG